MPATTATRAHARAETALLPKQARWALGFWGELHDRTRDVTVPRIWESLQRPRDQPRPAQLPTRRRAPRDRTHIGPAVHGRRLLQVVRSRCRSRSRPIRTPSSRSACSRSPSSSHRCSATTDTCTLRRSSRSATGRTSPLWPIASTSRPTTSDTSSPRASGTGRSPEAKTLLHSREEGGILPRSPCDDKPVELARSAICRRTTWPSSSSTGRRTTSGT